MVYISQTIRLYTFNLCSTVCQLHLNKIGIKKEYVTKNNKEKKYFGQLTKMSCYIWRVCDVVHF